MDIPELVHLGGKALAHHFPPYAPRGVDRHAGQPHGAASPTGIHGVRDTHEFFVGRRLGGCEEVTCDLPPQAQAEQQYFGLADRKPSR